MHAKSELAPLPLMSAFGEKVRALSRETWGEARQIHLIGRSAGLLKAQEKLTRFARIDRPMLLMGESGVGKELFACALYLLSARFGKPFLRVNCAQYQNEELLVSELFGHRKGSFTGAHAERRGLFEEAHGGMVFLDEVGELSPRAQAMLLRVLSEGEIKPLGESRFRQVDVHIVAATNRSLKQMVIEKSFREDLFYRLRYLHLPIPPLREREEDWRLIITFFLNRLNQRYHDTKQFSPAAWAVLPAMARQWYATYGTCTIRSAVVAAVARRSRSWSCEPSNPVRRPPRESINDRRITVKCDM